MRHPRQPAPTIQTTGGLDISDSVLATVSVVTKRRDREHARYHGEAMNDAGGIELMRSVFWAAKLTARDREWLELAWDGIGTWER